MVNLTEEQRITMLVELKLTQNIIPYENITDEELILAHKLYVVSNGPWLHGVEGIPSNSNPKHFTGGRRIL